MDTKLIWNIPHDSVVLPLQSKTIPDSMDELVPRALHSSGKLFHKRSAIAEMLRETIRKGLAEYHDRVAILHLTVDGLRETRVALGIAPNGLEPAQPGGSPFFVVLLFLLSEGSEGPYLTSYERKKLCHEKTVYKLRTARDVDAAIQAIRGGSA